MDELASDHWAVLQRLEQRRPRRRRTPHLRATGCRSGSESGRRRRDRGAEQALTPRPSIPRARCRTPGVRRL
jgi:hypothetical protein